MALNETPAKLMHRLAGTASLLALLLAATPALANESYCLGKACTNKTRGQVLDNAGTVSVPPGANSEEQTAADQVPGGFAISIDGEVVAGSRKLADRQRKTDKRLDAVDIEVKFDGLDVKPMLNVSTAPIRQSYTAGETVDFLASLNYADWVTSSEIRIFARGTSLKAAPLHVLKVAGNGTTSWTMPVSGPSELVYVLRVYDQDGRYDETKPLALARSAKHQLQHEPQDAAVAPGFGEDATAFRNIPVFGGAVTVFGRDVPEHDRVVIMGSPVPVDAEGKFVVQRILPPGDHQVSVRVLDDTSKGLEFNRDINIPANEWFYVALADLTLGHRFGSKGIEEVRPGEFNNIYEKGRLAFYLKGKIRGKTLLTASADIGEDSLKNMLKGLDSKDPRQFLKRINPEDYYPVYGDDSTAVEDAPTRGKFYVRLERGDSHVMWGNFKTQITGTRFMRNERALYGASAVYKSDTEAPNGERTTQASIYAARPGTLPQRDVLQGTGGSAYFLKHQDITVGSETVSIEVQDSVTKAVLQRAVLKYGVDYDFDYIQGLVLLKKPLPSTAAAGGVVSSSNDNTLNLAVSYEYTPASGDVSGYALGGRAEQWLGDHVRLGATGAMERTGGADQKAVGADVRIQHSQNTYVEAEVAHSKGPGFGLTRSSDGGLTLSDEATAGHPGAGANAYHVGAKFDLADVTNGSAKGDLDLHYTRQQAGFSSLDEQVTTGKEDYGAHLRVETGEKSDVQMGYTHAKLNDGHKDDRWEGHADMALGDHVIFSPGALYTNHVDPAAGAKDTGHRADVGARLAYQWNEDQSLSIFGQATVAKSATRQANNRAGVGGSTRLTEKSKLSGDLSYGTTGVGGQVTVDYLPTADDSYYTGYRLDPDRRFDYDASFTGTDYGNVIFGAKHRISEGLTVFAEDSYDLFGVKRTLAQTYGVNYTPDSRWSFGGNVEFGHIVDGTINSATLVKNSDFDRKAVSITLAYKDDGGNAARLKTEARFDRSDDHTRDLNQYVLSETAILRANPNWRLLLNLDAVLTDSTETTRNGDYVEGSVGYAYRPVDNDRLDALFKYTYLYDLPGNDQVTAVGSTLGPQQKTHILSADVNYDINQIITVGAKYGFRIGQTRPRDGSAGWTSSSAHLAILRADLNIVHNWDALAEARVLWSPQANTTDIGFLVAGYRHIGDNFKIGVGYNFGNFSDDLRDHSLDNHGIFLNAVGQF
jgi:hypothetical protein